MKQFMITVLAFLGIQAFAKDKDGKVALTEEQLTKLKGNLGEDFTEKIGNRFIISFQLIPQ